MSAASRYERYKSALERGHVASLRGRLEDALGAYAEAAAIVPGRPAPLASAGTALLRRQRPGDAVRYFNAALDLSPRDESAALGRAHALLALDHRAEAADAFDALADIRVSAGKLPLAVVAACQALETAEGRDRRRGLRELADMLRAAGPDSRDESVLDRAEALLGASVILDAPEPASAPGFASGPEPAVEPEPAPWPAPEVVPSPEPVLEPEPGLLAVTEWLPTIEPDPGLRVGLEQWMLASPAPWPELAVEPEPESEPVPEPVPVFPPGPLDRSLPDGWTLESLEGAAQDALAKGPSRPALARLLDVAAGCRREGRFDAALDACYRGLAVDPDDVDLHLSLVGLYTARGWAALASEKLDLIEHVIALDGDAMAMDRLNIVRGNEG